MSAIRRSLLSFLAVLLLVAPSTGASGARQRGFPQAQYLVVFVADGFRPDYLSLEPMRRLHELMGTGMSYNRAWVGQLESETPTDHATIATGVYPRKHGVLGFVWRDPTGQQILWMPTDLRLLNSGAMERLIESGGVPTISDLLHRRYPGAKIASLSGEKYYAADAMGTGADYIMYGKAPGKDTRLLAIGPHIPPASWPLAGLGKGLPAYPNEQDKFVARVAVQLVHTVRPRALLLNLPGPDIQGHITGGVYELDGVRAVVAGVDQAIGAVMDAYKAAGLFSRTLFVFTSDHGMIPNSYIAPKKAMNAALGASHALILKHDFLSTGGYVFLRNPQEAEKVASTLAAKNLPRVEGAFYKVLQGSTYSFRAVPSTARALGPALTRAYVDLSNTLAAWSGPEIVLPYAEDTLGKVVHGYGPHWGNHGGASWRTQYIPLVLSGPGVRQGESTYPAQLVDLAPTMERLLGLPIPKGVDGVVLADALRHPSSGDIRQQLGPRTQRAADEQALMQRSTRQNALVLK